VAWSTIPDQPFANASLQGFGQVPWSNFTWLDVDTPVHLGTGTEMLLYRAEGMLRDGNYSGAMELINQVRSMYMSDHTGEPLAPWTAMSLEEAWTHLKTERMIEGLLEGGMEALRDRPDLVGRTVRITAGALKDRLELNFPTVILDIRSDGERKDKHIPGSLHVPLNHLQDRLEEIPTEGPLVVQCAGGYRSAMAASILKRHHFAEVMDLVGGLGAWEASLAEH